MLTDAQVQAYHDRGYLVLERFLTPDQLATLRAATDALVEQSRRVSKSDAVFELEDDHTAEQPRLQRIKAPHAVDPRYLSIMRDERMLSVLRMLLGPALRLQNSKLNLKSALGSPVEWHQDWAFYPHTNDDVLAVGVMLDAMTPDNGPLMVVPGSHRGPLHDHHRGGFFCGAVDRAVVQEILPQAMPIHAPAGSISIHHARTLHGSDVNRSGQDRRLLLFEVTAADAWPLAGIAAMFGGLEDWKSRLLCGEEPDQPRQTAVPVRIPLPQHPSATSIFAVQRHGESYYAGREGAGQKHGEQEHGGQERGEKEGAHA